MPELTEGADATAYHTEPARVLFYSVDLRAGTAIQIGEPLQFPSNPVPQITDSMGAVFDHNDYFTIYTNLARSFFFSDVAGNIIAAVYDVICTLGGVPEFPGECYRARLFSDNELSSLITTAFTVSAS